MDGSYGAEMVCAYYPGKHNSTSTGAAPCKEQFPVAKSVFSRKGSCKNYSGGHSSGEHMARQGQGECKTTDFDIRSVVCFDDDA
jgi:hypothetical protein